MMKLFVLMLAFVIFMSMSASVFADPAEPDIIISSSPTGFTVVQGGNLNLRADWTTGQAVNRESWAVDGTVMQGPTSFDDSESGYSLFTFNAASLAVGSYTVTYKIWRARGGSHDIDREYEESEEVAVTATTTMTIYVLPMAAPRVAEIILSFNGVSARYGTAKSGGNYIKDVAAEMGDRSDFRGEAKEIWSEDAGMYLSRPAYRQAVLGFLRERLNWLEMPTDQDFANYTR